MNPSGRTTTWSAPIVSIGDSATERHNPRVGNAGVRPFDDTTVMCVNAWASPPIKIGRAHV